MPGQANLELGVIVGVVLFGWLMVRLVTWIKTRKINTELWCTVFEGLTQGAIRLDDLKQPETVIEKKMKRDGRDKDTPAPETDDPRHPGGTGTR